MMPDGSGTSARPGVEALIVITMDDISRHKAQLRTKQRELRALLNDWNPIGVGGLPDDEYDCFLRLVGDLHRGSSEAEVALYLREQLAEHFGLDPDHSQPEAFARRVFDWYWVDPLPPSLRP
jgi:hypothetical protein